VRENLHYLQSLTKEVESVEKKIALRNKWRDLITEHEHRVISLKTEADTA
jgi:hypothetical protein